MKDQQSLNKTRKVRWLRLKMKKCFETLQKHTMGVIFLNTQNSHLLTWSSPSEEIFQVHGQSRPVANL